MTSQAHAPTMLHAPAKYAPMTHQEETLALMLTTPIVFDMSDPGTGKTAVQIWAYARRRRNRAKHSGCALVVAPRSLLRSAWFDDFAKFAPELVCVVADADHREKAFAANADVYITNTDAVTWLIRQKPKFFSKFDTLIVDEVSSFKHHTSARSKALKHIKHYFHYRSVLSGTPNSNTILDIWNPVGILDDGKRLGKQFFGFRSAVCSPARTGAGADMIAWQDKEGAAETVAAMIADITIRHRFDDCIDIPETLTWATQYHLSAKQLKAYLSMERDQVAWLHDPAQNKTATILANSAATVTTKLLQIASGAVYEAPDLYHVVDTGRYELIIDLVEQRRGHHPLVFFQWKHQRDELVKLAKLRGLRYAVYDGACLDAERTAIVQAYQNGWYDLLLAHPKSAAHGLTLTRGCSTIWASPTYDLEWWTQGNRRQARNTQARKTEVLVVLASQTIDERVFARMQAKGAGMSSLLGLFEKVAP
jgi:SNF2 family DNA or RNA helicase